MMKELILSAISLYLLSKIGKKSSGDEVNEIDFPAVAKLGDVPLILNGKKIDKSTIEGLELNYAPWFWYTWKRPGVFNIIPLSPGSAKRWKKLSEIWRGMRGYKHQIELIDRLIQKNEASPLDIDLKDKYQNRIYQLFKDSKDLAKEQFQIEKNFLNLLKLNFNQSEINDFYAVRKKEILNYIYPKNETQIIPMDKINFEITNSDYGQNNPSL